MRTIVHLSDLHFGKVHLPTLEPLLAATRAAKPDVVAVSGDLTQRARAGQFREARAFLDQLPGAVIVVPGNHDLPLFNLVSRFFTPLRNYRRYITDDLSPSYVDEEIAVLGISSPRKLLHTGGRVNMKQVEETCEAFSGLGNGRTNVVVTHHPFDLPEGRPDKLLVRRAHQAMALFARCGVDVFLSGHLHVSGAGSTARYGIAGYNALVIQAGTALSSRHRGEVNAFNIIRVDDGVMTVETHTFDEETALFGSGPVRRYARGDGGWQPA